MGKIIRANSKELVKDLLPAIENHEDFQFVVVSDEIKTSKKKKNVCKVRALIPSVELITYFEEGKEKKFKKKYIEFLNKKEIDESYIQPFVVGIKEHGWSIVLVCSKDEDKYGFLKLICDHMEKKYGLKTVSTKKFLEKKEAK